MFRSNTSDKNAPQVNAVPQSTFEINMANEAAPLMQTRALENVYDRNITELAMKLQDRDKRILGEADKDW